MTQKYKHVLQWLIWWGQLMTDIAALPSTRNRVMVDILNEPDVLGLRCVPGLVAFLIWLLGYAYSALCTLLS